MTLEEKIGQMNQYSGFMDFTGPQPNEGRVANKLEQIKKRLGGFHAKRSWSKKYQGCTKNSGGRKQTGGFH